MPLEDEKSLRDQLEAAYDEEVEDEGDSGQLETESVSGADAKGNGQVAQARQGEGEGDQVDEPPAAVEESEGGDAGEKTKFLPPEGDEQGKPPGEEAPSPGTEPDEKVPAGWRGEAKLKWAEVPQEARQEIVRREKEVNDVLRDSVASRRFQDAFERTIAPFQQFIAADGNDPLTATRNLMQTAAVLRVGSPQQKAQTVAQIVRQFGIDIETLDSALAGASAQPSNGNGNGGMGPEVQHYIQQQLAPVNQLMAGLQQRNLQQKEQQTREVSEDIDAFEAGDHPFYEDVREDMALLFDRASRKNEDLSLEDAYQQALRMNDRVWDIVSKQKAAQQAQQGNKTLEAKKRAAASIKSSSPAPASPKAPTDLRGQLSAAWEKHSRGSV